MEPEVEYLMTVLPGFEGDFPWMYKDTTNNVTVGMGLLVPNFAFALRLPWAQQPTSNQVADDWGAVTTAPAGKLASFYRNLTMVRLPLGWSIQQASQSLSTQYLPAARRAYGPSWDLLPIAVRAAMLDIQYNVKGGLASFTHLLRDVRSGDMAQAAKDCHRQLPPARNLWTAKQFVPSL